MEAPAEAKPWKDYRPILVTEQRTKQGLEFMQEHSVALNRAESIYMEFLQKSLLLLLG